MSDGNTVPVEASSSIWNGKTARSHPYTFSHAKEEKQKSASTENPRISPSRQAKESSYCKPASQKKESRTGIIQYGFLFYLKFSVCQH
jgi:hypothetical protein